MTDSHSQENGWNGYVEDEAPTHIAGQTSHGRESNTPQYSSAPHLPQAPQPPRYPTAPGSYGQHGGQYGGPQNQGGQHGSHPYGAQNQGGQYGTHQYGGQQYGSAGHGAPQQQFGGPSQSGMYPMGAGVPGVTVDPLTGEPLSDKSKVAAGFLQFFLGGFGAGRFYIGDVTIGAIQLGLLIFGFITSFFIFGIFILFGLSLWALVDAILMWSGSVRDSQGRKLR